MGKTTKTATKTTKTPKALKPKKIVRKAALASSSAIASKAAIKEGCGSEWLTEFLCDFFGHEVELGVFDGVKRWALMLGHLECKRWFPEVVWNIYNVGLPLTAAFAVAGIKRSEYEAEFERAVKEARSEPWLLDCFSDPGITLDECAYGMAITGLWLNHDVTKTLWDCDLFSVGDVMTLSRSKLGELTQLGDEDLDSIEYCASVFDISYRPQDESQNAVPNHRIVLPPERVSGSTNVALLGLTESTYLALRRHASNLRSVCGFSERDLARLQGVQPWMVREIRSVVEHYGYSLVPEKATQGESSAGRYGVWA